ncbi:MAG: DUF4012 domain-containing protein [Methanobacteriaceae archaeon]|jgi:hypothetical protein|nr:DUF4012 domain-containing protein [Candidatus Methanorudis spinitermitis]
MNRKNKLLIGIAIVGLIGVGALIYGTFLSGPDLSQGNKKILVLAVDKGEQSGLGGVDMAFMVDIENGSIKKYTPIYPGGMKHPTQPAPGHLSGQMLLHDSLWDGSEQGMEYAKEIVEANTGMKADAVVAVTDEGMDAIIDSIRPFEVNGVVSDLDATNIVRENDQLYGNGMSRGEAVMVLVKAISKAATNPDKRNTMVQVALDQYSKGNIVMNPSSSFMSLLATKGFDSLVG